MMKVQRIREGLWRWTAPHPGWTPEKDKPGGWGQMVGCVYYEPPRVRARAARRDAKSPATTADAVVLIDPLAPPSGTRDAARFWKALDRDIERAGRHVAILLGNEYHSRSAKVILERYASGKGASIWAHEGAARELPIKVTHTFRPGEALPGGIESYSIGSLCNGEVVYYLPPHRALVVADALIGSAPGCIRVAPSSWAPSTRQGAARYRRQFRRSLRRLLDRPVSTILVSHGPPVLKGGRRALQEALDAPAWGE